MKQKLKDILTDPRGKCIAIDLDGTLSVGHFWEDDPVPVVEMIDLVWEWYKKGAHIIIYTARQPREYEQTLAWLVKNRVPFQGIAMNMKPSADVYIDDMALNTDDL